MSLRVVMVGACPYPAPQGSQVLMTETAKEIKALGHEVMLVVYGHGEGEPSIDVPVTRAHRVPGHRRTAAGPSPFKPLADLLLVAAIRRACREHRAQIVHAHNYEGLIAALVAGVRPIVYHAHNCMEDELPYFAPRGLRGMAAHFGRMLDQTWPRRADALIAPHEALARHLADHCGCNAEHVHVISPGCDPSPFRSAPVSGMTPPLLYTGNLDAYQNLALLREALDLLHRRFPDLRLIMATHTRTTLSWAEMRHLHSMRDLPEILAEESVFVCPRVSWSGYPMKLLNAMASGKPVVACRGAAPPIEHEHTGLLVDGRSAASFAEAVTRLLEHPELRMRLGQNARATILERHRPEQAAKALEEVYRKCLSPEAHIPKG